MKPAILILAAAFLTATAFADDQLRDVQTALKGEGFYFGEPDGKPGPETAASIRRFQIRNGLKVTGDLNTETLEALGVGGTPNQPRPTEEPSQRNPKPGPPPARTDKPTPQLNPAAPGDRPAAPKRADLLRDGTSGNEESGLRQRRPEGADEEFDPAPTRPRRVFPDDPAVVDPPTPVPGATDDDFGTFYHGTPYVNAPREVQVDIVRKAQTALARQGFFRARPDGFPGPSTADALFAYQGQRQLTRTGRLDLRTLADMNLLPGRGPDAPPARPFRDPGRGRDPGVDYRGIIR